MTVPAGTRPPVVFTYSGSAIFRSESRYFQREARHVRGAVISVGRGRSECSRKAIAST